MRIESFNCGGRKWSPELLADIKRHIESPSIGICSMYIMPDVKDDESKFHIEVDDDGLTWCGCAGWPDAVIVVSSADAVLTFYDFKL